MADIWTSKGWLPEASLIRLDGETDNENERTTWEEWIDASGETVKRNVHVTLKRGVEMKMELGDIG